MSRDTNLKCRGYQRGWSKLIRWLELRNSCSINSDDYVVVDFPWLQAGHPTRFRASGFPEAKNPYWISTVSCALQDYVALLFSSVCVCFWLFRNKNKHYFSHWPVIYIYIYTTHSVRNITLTILTNVPHLPCPVFTIYFFYVPMSYFLIILFILCISKPISDSDSPYTIYYMKRVALWVNVTKRARDPLSKCMVSCRVHWLCSKDCCEINA